MQDHNYAINSPRELKMKNLKLEESIKEEKRQKKNAKMREKRAKRKCGDLIKLLKDKSFVNSELEQKLKNYEGNEKKNLF